MDPDVAFRIGALADDHLSGATDLAAGAADIFALAAQSSRAPGAAQFLADLAEVGRFLAVAQPAMAPLWRLANIALWAAERAPVGEKRAAVEQAARAFAVGLTTSAAGAVAGAAATLPAHAVVVTHSASSVVEATLRHAHTQGRLRRVIVSEARPLVEGVALARRLAGAGIPVTLVTDALAPSLVDEADVVVVGADTVAATHVVNKAGTYPLALAARAAGTPLMVVASSEKLLPASLFDAEGAVGEGRDAAQVLAQAPPGVTILNRQFDLTPLDLVTWVVTEAGPLRRDDVIAACEAIVVHPALLS